MNFTIVVIVVAVAVVLDIIELGLTAYLVSWIRPGTPGQFSFMLFNSLWSLLVLAYVGLTPTYYDRLFHRLAALGLELVTLIFWFAGSIALAVWIPASVSCGASVPCGTAKAASAFGFFLWLAFTGLAAIDGLEVMRAPRDGGGPPKPAQQQTQQQPIPVDA